MNKFSDLKDNNFKKLKNIKLNLLKKLFFGNNIRKIITWRLGDVINNKDNHL